MTRSWKKAGPNRPVGIGFDNMRNALRFFFTLAILLIPATFLYAGQETSYTKPLRVGFSARVFPNIDQRDARIAMELWSREMAGKLGFKPDVQTIIFQKPSEILETVNRGDLTVVTLPATEYLQIRDKALMTPVIVEASNEGFSRRFMLIARKDSGIRSFRDLRGKSILIPDSTRYETSHIWLDVLLLKEGVADRSSFFRQIKKSTPSQAIMGVFFRQGDAAIVTRAAMETSKALNAQLGKELNVVVESKHLIGDITCVPLSNGDRMKREVENAALHLHESATGRQMFTLFHIERTIPFKQAYIDGLIELLMEEKSLRARSARKR